MITKPAKEFSKYLPANYRKKNVFVTYVTPPYTQSLSVDWGGGSRDSYSVIRQNSSNHEPVGGSTWGKKPEDYPKVTLLAGDVLIQSGIFMGKSSTAHLYICLELDQVNIPSPTQ